MVSHEKKTSRRQYPTETMTDADYRLSSNS